MPAPNPLRPDLLAERVGTHIANDPAGVSRNFGTGLIGGVLGLPSDLLSLMGGLVRSATTPFPVGFQAPNVPGNSQQIQSLLGGDPSAPESLISGLLAPGPGELKAAAGIFGAGALRAARNAPNPVPVTRALEESDVVEMVPIEDLERLVVNDRMTQPKSLSAIDEPTETVLAGLRDDLANGRPIRQPLDVEVNPETGRALLADGNTRFAAIKEAGFTHAPVRITRSNTTFGQQLEVTGDASADRVRPSDFGLK